MKHQNKSGICLQSDKPRASDTSWWIGRQREGFTSEGEHRLHGASAIADKRMSGVTLQPWPNAGKDWRP